MRPTIVLMAVVCWSTACTIAAAQTQCVSFSDTIDGVDKDRAVEKSLKSLDEQIEKWKADNGVTGPVTVTAEKPQPHPFWRSSVPSYALLPPDVVSDLRTRSAGPVWCRPWSAPPAPGCVGEVIRFGKVVSPCSLTSAVSCSQGGVGFGRRPHVERN